MDREDFPTLEHGDTGWPVMRIPFGSREPIEVEYNEGGNEYEDTVVIRTGGRPVLVLLDGVEVLRAQTSNDATSARGRAFERVLADLERLQINLEPFERLADDNPTEGTDE